MIEASGVNPTFQARLAAVLRYRTRGDFAAFCHAADLAMGSTASDVPFYCANLLFAYQMAGLCDVSAESGSIEWWAAHVGDISIHADWDKEIGALPAWFASTHGAVTPLISDTANTPLVLGTVKPSHTAYTTRSVFSRAITQTIPPFKDIERQLCVEVPYSDDYAGTAEVFDVRTAKWSAGDDNFRLTSRLIRVKTDYSGYRFFVEHPAIGLRFRVTQPEWAHVIAYHLLPWRLSDLLDIAGDDVRVRRAIRLPIHMYRSLFAASEHVIVGPTVRFSRVSTDCLSGFRQYFSAVGDRP